MRRLSKRGKIAAIILSLVVGIVYYVFVDREHVYKRAQGWSLHHSYRHFACPTCTGRVEELKCNGDNISVPELPELPDESSPKRRMIRMYSPVGALELWDRSIGWHLRHESDGPGDLSEAIMSEELARGYYENEIHSWPPARKRGTPDHWCQVGRLMDDRGCWMAPELISRIRWSGERTMISDTSSD